MQSSSSEAFGRASASQGQNMLPHLVQQCSLDGSLSAPSETAVSVATCMATADAVATVTRSLKVKGGPLMQRLHELQTFGLATGGYQPTSSPFEGQDHKQNLQPFPPPMIRGGASDVSGLSANFDPQQTAWRMLALQQMSSGLVVLPVHMNMASAGSNTHPPAQPQFQQPYLAGLLQ